MPKPKKFYLTAQDIEDTAKKLVKKLKKFNLGGEDTLVVGVGRGGLIAAQYVAYGLGVRDITCIQSKLYDGEQINETKMEVSGALMIDYDYENIIVVDDLVDTGITLDVIIEIMDQMAAEFDSNAAIIPAVLYSQKSKKELAKNGTIPGKILKKGKGKGEWLEFPWDTFMEK